MQGYDVTLKLLLHSSPTLLWRELAGSRVTKWFDVELPNVQNLRVDLLGETADGGLIHVELQSSNDPDMALRMAEYWVAVYKRFGKAPDQVVLYIGDAPMRMKDKLIGPDFRFTCRLLDIRDLESEQLLNSHDIGDNVIAILTRLRDDKEAVRRIVKKIAGLPAGEREKWLAQLLILAGARRLETVVTQEAEKMPIDLDIRDHAVLGPMFRKAEEDGLHKGLEQGRQDGERALLRHQIRKRFGALPGWADEKLSSFSISELENLADRLFDAASLEELLG